KLTKVSLRRHSQACKLGDPTSSPLELPLAHSRGKIEFVSFDPTHLLVAPITRLGDDSAKESPMLIFSLILSSVLLAVVYWEARKKSEGYVRAFVVAILGGVASLFFCVAPVAALTGLFAAVVFLLGALGKSSPRRLIVLCFAATIVFHAG